MGNSLRLDVFASHISQWQCRVRPDEGGRDLMEEVSVRKLIVFYTWTRLLLQARISSLGIFEKKDLQNSCFGKMPNEQVKTSKFNPRLKPNLTFTKSISGKQEREFSKFYLHKSAERLSFLYASSYNNTLIIPW